MGLSCRALQVQQVFDIIEQHTDNIYVPGFGTYTVSWVATVAACELGQDLETSTGGWAPADISYPGQAFLLLVGLLVG